MTTELYWLALVILMTSLMWLPYIAKLLLDVGVRPALQTAVADRPVSAAWVTRAVRAHANAVENLVLFAPLVLTAHAVGIHTQLTAGAAAVYFWARAAHYLLYLAGFGPLRTLCFAAGLGAQLAFVYAILSQA